MVTDYLHLVEPILQAREAALGETNEVQYLIENKERLLDANEKGRYREGGQASESPAETLLQAGNDLKGVKIHDFKRYM